MVAKTTIKKHENNHRHTKPKFYKPCHHSFINHSSNHSQLAAHAPATAPITIGITAGNPIM